MKTKINIIGEPESEESRCLNDTRIQMKATPAKATPAKVMLVQDGALKYKGSNGTVTAIALA
jgi:hypothetical protein